MFNTVPFIDLGPLVRAELAAQAVCVQYEQWLRTCATAMVQAVSPTKGKPLTYLEGKRTDGWIIDADGRNYRCDGR